MNRIVAVFALGVVAVLGFFAFAQSSTPAVEAPVAQASVQVSNDLTTNSNAFEQTLASVSGGRR